MSKVRRYEVTAAGDFASVLSVLTDHLGLRLLSLDEGEVAPMLGRQKLACSQTFSFAEMSASRRCAEEIRALLK